MKARWPGICAKCDTSYIQGADIKRSYVMRGFDHDGRPIYTLERGKYRHVRCPKVTPNRPGQRPVNVDPVTGEVIVTESHPAPHQETLL